MPELSKMSDRDFLLHAFRGNAAAVEYVLMIAQVVGVWDDLIDKDKAACDADINLAFWNLAVMIPRNPFFQAHMADLLPVTATGICNWLIANKYEEKLFESRGIEIAHAIRYSIADVAILAAALIGGPKWVEEVGPELRMRSQRSDFNEYVDSLTAKEGVKK